MARTGDPARPVTAPVTDPLDLTLDRTSPAPLHHQPAQQLEAAGQSPTTRVLRNERVPATAEVAAALALPEGTDVTVLERLRGTHGRPVALLRNHLPTPLLQLGTARLESTGLYRMPHSAGIAPHRAHQSVGARGATAAEAALLDEKEGAALLTTRRTAYDRTGRPVEYGSHVHRASHHCFDFQLLVRP
ncbi:GntR family transcriptional regulator [Streptomyces sp. NPDC048297]|uniref:GntR family transcriptional regulator n=1 Tax=Streptomyces sp. NPDC048297 TaxID=3365531 RepID=UPI0037240356